MKKKAYPAVRSERVHNVQDLFVMKMDKSKILGRQRRYIVETEDYGLSTGVLP